MLLGSLMVGQDNGSRLGDTRELDRLLTHNLGASWWGLVGCRGCCGDGRAGDDGRDWRQGRDRVGHGVVLVFVIVVLVGGVGTKDGVTVSVVHGAVLNDRGGRWRRWGRVGESGSCGSGCEGCGDNRCRCWYWRWWFHIWLGVLLVLGFLERVLVLFIVFRVRELGLVIKLCRVH